MNKLTRKNFLRGMAAAVALPVIGSSAAFANQFEKITSSGKLRVGIDTGFPPFGFLDAGLKPVGSDVEIAQALAADWKLQLELIGTVSATRVPNLTSDRADIIISSLAITPERAQVIDFSRPFSAILAVVVGAKSLKVSSMDDLKGNAVAVTRGAVSDRTMSSAAEKGGFTVRRFDDDATLVTAAVTGQARLVGTASNIGHEIVTRNPDFERKFVQETYELAIGLRKGEPALKAKLDEWILTNLRNGRINAIYKKYHFADLPESISNQK
jgi:polar amino acid transport system substrate-binding protein